MAAAAVAPSRLLLQSRRCLCERDVPSLLHCRCARVIPLRLATIVAGWRVTGCHSAIVTTARHAANMTTCVIRMMNATQQRLVQRVSLRDVCCHSFVACARVLASGM